MWCEERSSGGSGSTGREVIEEEWEEEEEEEEEEEIEWNWKQIWKNI
jgi:predicted kinase